MAEKIFTSQERTFERTQGCWNCKHMQPAKPYWEVRRQQDLKVALERSLNDPRGEDEPRVVNIRRMTDKIDNLVAVGKLIRCTTGKQPDGSPVADLVMNAYLCDQWSGASGSSLARDIGKTDELPEELSDRVDGGKPWTTEQLSEIIGRKGVK